MAQDIKLPKSSLDISPSLSLSLTLFRSQYVHEHAYNLPISTPMQYLGNRYRRYIELVPMHKIGYFTFYQGVSTKSTLQEEKDISYIVTVVR